MLVDSWITSPTNFRSMTQFPRSIANTAVDVAYKVLAGEPVEKTMLIPVHLITEENLHEYSLEGWQ